MKLRKYIFLLAAIIFSQAAYADADFQECKSKEAIEFETLQSLPFKLDTFLPHK